MKPKVDQNRIIANLNKYLQWHNLPLSIIGGGYCNGLSAVYIKYYLEEKEDEFWEMLQYIAGKIPSTVLEDKVNHFVVEVIISQHPASFVKKFNQQNSLEILSIASLASIEGNEAIPLLVQAKPLFKLAMLTTDENWADIFKTLNLEADEAMRVGGLGGFNHTVAITKKNGKYVVYDPNYSSGFKVFSQEIELIQELHKHVFHDNNQLLIMDISIFRHPNKENPRPFPEVKDLYNRYLNFENVNVVIKDRQGISYSTLVYSVIFNDADSIRQLLSLGATDIECRAIRIAIEQNCPQALGVLLENNTFISTSDICMFFRLALASGREESFDELYNNPSCKIRLEEMLFCPDLAHELIQAAAAGSNPRLLEKVMNLYFVPRKMENTQIFNEILERFGTTVTQSAGYQNIVELILRMIADKSDKMDDNKLAKQILKKNDKGIDAIDTAINADSRECLEVLLKRLATAKHELSDDQKMHYLFLAIQNNYPTLIPPLLEIIDPKFIKAISMSVRTIDNTDLSILRELGHYGIFSEFEQAIIARKEHRSIGILLMMGIMFYKFTDFIKEELFNFDKLKFFKVPEAEKIIPEPTPDTPHIVECN